MTHPTRFQLLGEPLVLDLVNTRALRRGAAVDLLERPAALTAWLRAERERLAWRGPAASADLVAVCGLRDALDALLRARLARTTAPDAAVRRLNRALAGARDQARLEWTRAGPRKTAAPAGASRDGLLQRLALDGLELLTGPDADKLRECAHPDCRMLFMAANPKRQWCSAATCGNRARVSRHHARTVATGRP
jgi:predicted RNA-binding Zn ribbon-like protein